MASKPLFLNPAVSQTRAKATRVPMNEPDPELGEVSPPQESVIPITPPEKKVVFPTSPIFRENYMYGLTGKGKKSRKQKRRAPKKTQKRRARK